MHSVKYTRTFRGKVLGPKIEWLPHTIWWKWAVATFVPYFPVWDWHGIACPIAAFDITAPDILVLLVPARADAEWHELSRKLHRQGK